MTTRAGRATVDAAHEPSPDTLRACSALGVVVSVSRTGARPPANDDAADTITRTLRPGAVALVTGPSGVGKSTLAQRIARLLRRSGARVAIATPEPPMPPGRGPAPSVVDSLTGPVERRLALLSSAGLADAALLPRSALVLSAGEAWRLGLARALAFAGPEGWVIADEFGSLLDRVTARRMARSFGKWIRRTRGVRAIAITAHDDLRDALRPELTVRLAPCAPAEIERDLPPAGERGW